MKFKINKKKNLYCLLNIQVILSLIRKKKKIIKLIKKLLKLYYLICSSNRNYLRILNQELKRNKNNDFC